MPTAEMDTAMRGLKSVMERTLDTRHVIHIFQGKHSLQPYVDMNSLLPVCAFTTERFFLLFAGHMVTSSAHHTVLLTPQTASTSLEEEAGLCSR